MAKSFNIFKWHMVQMEVVWFPWFLINAVRTPFISKSPVGLLTFAFKDKLDYITYLYYVHHIKNKKFIRVKESYTVSEN